MYTYVDVYKRPVQIGDIVLCMYGNCYCDPYEIRHAILVEVGNETEQVYKSDGKVYCYKLEDNAFRTYARNFRYEEWSDRYESSGLELLGVYEGGRLRTEIVEMLDRTVKLGDLVIYELRKTKANYGVLVSKNQVITQSGKLKKISCGLLLENLTAQEAKIKAELSVKYKMLVSEQARLQHNDKVKTFDDMKLGEVYLTQDARTLFIRLGMCGYTVTFNDIGTSTSPYYDDLTLKISMSSKCGKELKQALDAGKQVKLSDLIPYCALNEIKNKRYWTPWDETFGRRHKNGAGKMLFYRSFLDFIFTDMGGKLCWKVRDEVRFSKYLTSIGRITVDKHVQLCSNDEIHVILNLQ